MDGLILVDKPPGPSSFDVVKRLRWRVSKLKGTSQRRTKTGHTGTLDPFASGLLPICVGKATKLARFLSDADKSYVATARLGITTTTGDPEGEIVAEADASGLEIGEVRSQVEALGGRHLQTPPAYSAIHIDGKRAYQRARDGEDIVMPKREVEVFDVQVLAMSLPLVTFGVTVSKGTYIRTLCTDLGERLGVGAHCVSLRRTRSAGFEVTDAVEFGALSTVSLEELEGRLISPFEMLSNLASVTISEPEADRIGQGQRIPVAPGVPRPTAGPVRVTADGLTLVCVGHFEGDMLVPDRVLRENKPGPS